MQLQVYVIMNKADVSSKLYSQTDEAYFLNSV